MNELTRKAMVETVENVIEDYENRELSETDLEDLNHEQLLCISECLQFGQLKNKLSDLEKLREQGSEEWKRGWNNCLDNILSIINLS